MPLDPPESPSEPASSDVWYFPPLTKEELFDHIAAEHDGFAFTEDDAPKVAVLKKRLGDLTGLQVMEPGCGSGYLTACLADWVGTDGGVLAFDPSLGMVERARSRTKIKVQVKVQRAALETIALPDAGFDRVVCFRVWPHFEDDEIVMAKIARWLRPGGKLLIVHWDGREKLAAIHASHHTVESDVFPPREKLEPALVRHGFTLGCWIDTSEEIFIEAVFQSPPR